MKRADKIAYDKDYAAAKKDGKPFDEAKYIEGKHKMKPIVEHLAELLGKPVKLAPRSARSN